MPAPCHPPANRKSYRGLVGNEPIGTLAHLGFARAYALSGDSAKAKSAYQDFFALWKDADADPDIPILKEAKAEYAKVQKRLAGLRTKLRTISAN